MDATRSRPGSQDLARGILESPVSAVLAIWASTGVTSVLAPDLVSGSEQEHLPLALLTGWLWACVASLYALLTPRRESRAGWTVSVVLVWTASAVVAILAPVLVTGSDPTRLPLAVLVAPPAAAVATGVLSLLQALGDGGRRSHEGTAGARGSGTLREERTP